MALSGVKRVWRSQREVATPELTGVLVGAIIVMFGFGMVLPAIPLFAKSFGVGDAMISMLVVGFAAMRLVGNTFVGTVITRWGERWTTVAGATIVGASSILAGLAPDFWWMLGFRVAGGVGSAFYFGGLLSFLLARVPPEQRGRASSLFQGAVGIGLAFGPVVGGAILELTNERVPFFVYGGMCFAGAAWSFFRMSAPVREHGLGAARPQLGIVRQLLRQRPYRIALAVSMVGFVVTISPQILFPSLFVGELGMGASSVGIALTLMAVASLAVIVHAGNLVDRKGRRGVIVGGSIALALSYAALGGATNFFTGALAVVVVGAALGYTRPVVTSIVADVSDERDRAAAIGGYRVAQDVGALVGPAIAGIVSEMYGPRVALLTLGGLAGLVALWTFRIEETAPHLTRAEAPSGA